eukprot:TRINITY_DN22296_c0_g1_i1.p1 TRINITY_DN22296_c0_g1~~TRINITY_DN22296_c0_g1_i1.p1  ORF type:complete len:102 (+),score=19.49 TRINITY_DN22296_c0_g1_i1:67-372(+)
MAGDPATQGTRPLAAVIQELLVSWGSEIIEACESGDAEVAGDAMFRRASYHLVGWGVFDRSRDDAIKWLRKAVERGYPAQKMLERVKKTPVDHEWKHWADD